MERVHLDDAAAGADTLECFSLLLPFRPPPPLTS